MSTQSAVITIGGFQIKIAMIALCCLVAQTTAAVVLTRYSKMATETPNPDGTKRDKYSNASLVVSTEFVKFVASLGLVFIFDTVEKLQADAKADRDAELSPAISNGASGAATPSAAERDVLGADKAAAPEGGASGTSPNTHNNSVAVPVGGPQAASSVTGASVPVVESAATLLLTDAVAPLLSLRGLTTRYAAWKSILHKENFKDIGGTMKLAVPALLYTVQNNVIYTALNNLEATTFQVGYQSKVVTTAILSVLMLNRSLSPLKWLSLLILTAGIVFTQLKPATDGNKSSSHGTAHNQMITTMAPMAGDNGNVIPLTTAAPFHHSDDSEHNNQLVGMLAVMVASFCSAFAGVYFEKILKGTAPSVWVRNAQLAFFSMVIGLIGYYLSLHPDDKFHVMDYFKGYNMLVLLIIVVQALGGLIIACVVKYADNILKGFATAMSIVLCGILSSLFMGFIPSVMFVFGSAVVILATLLYSKPDAKK